jgi:hypothetical protein
MMLIAKKTPKMLKGALRETMAPAKVATGSNQVRAIQVRGARDTRDVVQLEEDSVSFPRRKTSRTWSFQVL